MKLLTMTLTAALLASPAVHAACTTDEVNAKADELAKRVNQLTESNPERAKEINEKSVRWTPSAAPISSATSARLMTNVCSRSSKRARSRHPAGRHATLGESAGVTRLRASCA